MKQVKEDLNKWWNIIIVRSLWTEVLQENIKFLPEYVGKYKYKEIHKSFYKARKMHIENFTLVLLVLYPGLITCYRNFDQVDIPS